MPTRGMASNYWRGTGLLERAQQPIAAHSSGVRFLYGKYSFLLHLKYKVSFYQYLVGLFRSKEVLGGR